MKNMTRFSVEWHRSLRWFGGVTILVWAISGAMHPLMSWTGPKAENFFPPRFKLAPEQLEALPKSIQRAKQSLGIDVARVVKIVPSEHGPLLQLTQEFLAERQYVDMSSSELLSNYDSSHAQWLGQYYTGRSASEILHIERLEEFTPEYPSVNRLLPVYRLQYKGEDGLTAYIHTETNALAGLSNSRRDIIQGIFRALHTWSWMDVAGLGRVMIIALLSLSAIAMAITGVALVFSFKSRKITDLKRRWHRRVAYLIWLPLLAWSISGFYHLLQAEYVKHPMGMHLDKAFSLTGDFTSFDLQALEQLQGANINAIALVRGENDESLLRLSFARGHSGTVSREEKFKGQSREKSSLYWDISKAKPVETNDHARAIWLAQQYANVDSDAISSASLITHFGPDYDFRNKRLPVWHVTIRDDNNTNLFIDPTTGILVDQNRRMDRMESWSFSLLHKWNFFNAFTTRKVRDVVIVVFLGISILFTLVGMCIRLRRNRKASYALKAVTD